MPSWPPRPLLSCLFFFFNDTATTEIYTRKDTLSLTTLFRSLGHRLDAAREDREQRGAVLRRRSEEHTSELQSPFLISYAVFCLKKKKNTYNILYYILHYSKKYTIIIRIKN